MDYDFLPYGFLQAINDAQNTSDDLFALRLHYDQAPCFATGKLNGNTSAATIFSTSVPTYTQAYEYDDLSRLTSVTHHATNGSIGTRYASAYSYDALGNLLTLERKGQRSAGGYGDIDQLECTLQAGSNQIDRIDDDISGPDGYDATGSGVAYQYDASGNVVYDPSRDLTIDYNFLNLPWRFVRGEEGEGGEYAGPYQFLPEERTVYEGDKTTTTAEIPTTNAIAFTQPCTERIHWRYEYYLKDHLGNTRVRFADLNLSGDISANEVLSEHHYYGFGLEMEGAWNRGGDEARYRYNGMERNEDLGLDLAPFRSYDPTTGRWLQVDPLAKLMPSMTPYRFGFSNPTLWADPLGLFESRGEARRFRRKHGLRGRIKRTSKDADGNKTFAFTDRKSKTEYTYGAGSAGNYTPDRAYPTSETATGESVRLPSLNKYTISEYKPNAAERFRDANMVTGAIYDIADNAAMTIQAMNPLQTEVRHLSNKYANQAEIQSSLPNTIINVLPQGKGLKAVKAAQGPGIKLLRQVKLKEVHQTLLKVTDTYWHPKITAIITRRANQASTYVNEAAEKTILKKTFGEAQDFSEK